MSPDHQILGNLVRSLKAAANDTNILVNMLANMLAMMLARMLSLFAGVIWRRQQDKMLANIKHV